MSAPAHREGRDGGAVTPPRQHEKRRTRSVSPATSLDVSACASGGPSSSTNSRLQAPPPQHPRTRQARLDNVAYGGHEGNSSTPHPPGVVSFDNNKAGLQMVDKEKTEKLIRELSEGSAFYTNEQRKVEARERKVQELLRKAKLFEKSVPPLGTDAAASHATATTPTAYAKLVKAVNDMESELLTYGDELGLKQERVFVHVDMDMFYAAVEEKKNPKLRDVPFGVGSLQMLSTTNYIARQYGVRSGMPGFIGRKLCPDLLIVPTDFAAYKREATATRAVVARYDPGFTSGGWDELTMELSGYLAKLGCERHNDGSSSSQEETEAKDEGEEALTAEDRRRVVRMKRLFKAAEPVVAAIRAEVFAATQLTMSAGIAPTATLAKMASSINKPNGQCTLPLCTRKAIMAFIHGLPCRKIPGIGKSQEHILGGLGVHTVGDIYRNRVLLCHLIPHKTFRFLLSTSLGVGGMFSDEREDATASTGDGRDGEEAEEEGGEAVGYSWRRKSIGQERTFYKLRSAAELKDIAVKNMLKALCGMKKEGFLARQIVLKLKHVSFQVKQYSKGVSPPTDDADTLEQHLNALLAPVVGDYADYRLLGVRLEKLITREQYEQEQAQEREAQGGRQQQQQLTIVELLGRKGKSKRTTRASAGAHGKRSRSPSLSSWCLSISDDDSSDSGYSCHSEEGEQYNGDGGGEDAESDDAVVIVAVEEPTSTAAPSCADPRALPADKSESAASVEIVAPPSWAKDVSGEERRAVAVVGGGPREQDGADDDKDEVVVVE